MTYEDIYSFLYCPYTLNFGKVKRQVDVTILEDMAVRTFRQEKEQKTCLTQNEFTKLFNKYFWSNKELNETSMTLSNQWYSIVLQWFKWYKNYEGELLNIYVPFLLDTVLADYFIAPLVFFDKTLIVHTFNQKLDSLALFNKDLYYRTLGLAIYQQFKVYAHITNWYVTPRNIVRNFTLETNDAFLHRTEELLVEIINRIRNKTRYPVLERCKDCLHKDICFL